MPNKLTARDHWDKAFDYFWKGNRRRTIEEASAGGVVAQRSRITTRCS